MVWLREKTADKDGLRSSDPSKGTGQISRSLGAIANMGRFLPGPALAVNGRFRGRRGGMIGSTEPNAFGAACRLKISAAWRASVPAAQRSTFCLERPASPPLAGPRRRRAPSQPSGST